MMTRDDARAEFKKCGLSYKNVYAKDIDLLWELLNKNLNTASKKKLTSVPLRMSKVKKVNYADDGKSIRDCYIYVNGDYFTRRECISFNVDGFIGFAGWADSVNIEPILSTFCEWCNLIKESRNNCNRAN